jgi:hypothetical protein
LKLLLRTFVTEVSLSRLELLTLRLSGVYSNQLSYKLFMNIIETATNPKKIRLNQDQKLKRQNPERTFR